VAHRHAASLLRFS
jgi:RNA recognition motif-containing protein